MDSQKFCLKWDGFQTSVISVFDHLRQDEELVDVTLCCEGHRVSAHRMMLSACSPYFRDILKVSGEIWAAKAESSRGVVRLPAHRMEPKFYIDVGVYEWNHSILAFIPGFLPGYLII